MTHLQDAQLLGNDGDYGSRAVFAAAQGACVRIVPSANAYALPICIEGRGGETFSCLLPCTDLKEVHLRLDQPALVRADGASIAPLAASTFWLGVGTAPLLRTPIIRAPLAGATVLLQASGKRRRSALRKDLKMLKLFGLAPQLRSGDVSAGLALGFAAAPPRGPSHHPTSLKVGVVVHLHFADVWPDIAASLRGMPKAFGLIVTLTARDEGVERAIKSDFPNADIQIVPNAGRDVRPFLALLDAGALDGFDIVCKLHGKKSLRNGKPTALGDLWRRSALQDLIGGSGRLDEVLTRFENDPRLGLLGPERFRVPNRGFSLHDAWSGNQSATLRMAGRLGLPPSFDLDFFAGTMFWVRPAALSALREVTLGDPATYAPEAGRTDGAIEHALERLFTTSVTTAGFTLDALAPV